MKYKVKAPAKINLTLEVIRKLPNGYHELRSTILKLDNLFDEITLEINQKIKGINIRSTSKDIPLNQENICCKAAEEYLEKAKKSVGLNIYIKKDIPVAAGLGGGSSDAAAVLLVLNKYFRNPFSEKQLIDLAASIGKDVPLFIKSSQVVIVSGMGEKIKEVNSDTKLFFLVVNPKIAVLTKEAFGLLSGRLKDFSKIRRVNKTRQMEKIVAEKNIKKIASSLYNDFEIVVEKMYPEISKIKQKLLGLGAQGALMSGSGSTVFGLFQSEREVKKAERNLKRIYPQYIIKKG